MRHKTEIPVTTRFGAADIALIYRAMAALAPAPLVSEGERIAMNRAIIAEGRVRELESRDGDWQALSAVNTNLATERLHDLLAQSEEAVMMRHFLPFHQEALLEALRKG